MVLNDSVRSRSSRAPVTGSTCGLSPAATRLLARATCTTGLAMPRASRVATAAASRQPERSCSGEREPEGAARRADRAGGAEEDDRVGPDGAGRVQVVPSVDGDPPVRPLPGDAGRAPFGLAPSTGATARPRRFVRADHRQRTGLPVRDPRRRAHDHIFLRTASSVSSASRPFWFALAAAGALGCLLAAAVTTRLARGIASPVVQVARASSRVAAGDSPHVLPVTGHASFVTSRSRSTPWPTSSHVHAMRNGRSCCRSHQLKTPLDCDSRLRRRAGGRGAHPKPRGQGHPPRGGAPRAADRGPASARAHQPPTLRHPARDGRPGRARARVHCPSCSERARARCAARARVGHTGSCASGWGATPAGPFEPRRKRSPLHPERRNGHARRRGGRAGRHGPGPGIAPEDVPHAFERFFLYRRYDGNRPVGTGLGLAIVKELAQAMEGTSRSRALGRERRSPSTFPLRTRIRRPRRAFGVYTRLRSDDVVLHSVHAGHTRAWDNRPRQHLRFGRSV